MLSSRRVLRRGSLKMSRNKIQMSRLAQHCDDIMFVSISCVGMDMSWICTLKVISGGGWFLCWYCQGTLCSYIPSAQLKPGFSGSGFWFHLERWGLMVTADQNNLCRVQTLWMRLGPTLRLKWSCICVWLKTWENICKVSLT